MLSYNNNMYKVLIQPLIHVKGIVNPRTFEYGGCFVVTAAGHVVSDVQCVDRKPNQVITR